MSLAGLQKLTLTCRPNKWIPQTVVRAEKWAEEVPGTTPRPEDGRVMLPHESTHV